MSNQNPFFFVFSLSLSLSLSLFCLGCNEYVEQFWKKQKWEKWEILGIGKIARVVGCEAGGSASEKMHQHSYGAIL